MIARQIISVRPGSASVSFKTYRIINNKKVNVEVHTGSYKIFLRGKLVDEQYYHVELEGDPKTSVKIHFSNISKMGAFIGAITRDVIKRTEVSDIVNISGFWVNSSHKRKRFAFKAEVPHTTRCKACKILYTIACKVGCGVGLYVLCALAGLAFIVGGIGCAVIGAIVCHFVGAYGCNDTSEAACRKMRQCP